MSSDTFSVTIPEFFYDLIAILIPGLAAIALVYAFFPESAQATLTEYPAADSYFVLVFVAYILGHATYSLSTTVVSGTFERLSGSPIKALLGGKVSKGQRWFNRHFLREDLKHDHYFEANVRDGVQRYSRHRERLNFGKPEDVDIAYEFCRHFIMERAPRNFLAIRKEQAYGELARSMTLLLGVFTLVGVWCLVSAGPSEALIRKEVLVGVLLVSFAFRYGQARHTVPIFIFSSFCTFLDLKREDNHDEDRYD